MMHHNNNIKLLWLTNDQKVAYLQIRQKQSNIWHVINVNVNSSLSCLAVFISTCGTAAVICSASFFIFFFLFCRCWKTLLGKFTWFLHLTGHFNQTYACFWWIIDLSDHYQLLAHTFARACVYCTGTIKQNVRLMSHVEKKRIRSTSTCGNFCTLNRLVHFLLALHLLHVWKKIKKTHKLMSCCWCIIYILLCEMRCYVRLITGLSSPSNTSSFVKSLRQSLRVTSPELFCNQTVRKQKNTLSLLHMEAL